MRYARSSSHRTHGVWKGHCRKRAVCYCAISTVLPYIFGKSAFLFPITWPRVGIYREDFGPLADQKKRPTINEMVCSWHVSNSTLPRRVSLCRYQCTTEYLLLYACKYVRLAKILSAPRIFGRYSDPCACRARLKHWTMRQTPYVKRRGKIALDRMRPAIMNRSVMAGFSYAKDPIHILIPNAVFL